MFEEWLWRWLYSLSNHPLFNTNTGKGYHQTLNKQKSIPSLPLPKPKTPNKFNEINNPPTGLKEVKIGQMSLFGVGKR